MTDEYFMTKMEELSNPPDAGDNDNPTRAGAGRSPNTLAQAAIQSV
jgi:hypothetical protein